MTSYGDLVAMGLERASLASNDRVDHLSDFDRIVNILVEKAKTESDPWNRTELEASIAKAQRVSEHTVWLAISDLILAGALQMYHGEQAGDTVSAIFVAT